MAVKLKNPKTPPKNLVSGAEMEHGVLYKLADKAYDTIYTKTLSGLVIWFEDGRIGSAGLNELDKNKRFIAAPVGTSIHLEQDACILA